jgi:pyruvate formate lyase activating enzyme
MPRDHGVCAGSPRSPEVIVSSALQSRCQSVSFTYTEPTVYYELAFETARCAAAAGLKAVFVTNGYIAPEPLKAISPYVQAANIDLQA